MTSRPPLPGPAFHLLPTSLDLVWSTPGGFRWDVGPDQADSHLSPCQVVTHAHRHYEPMAEEPALFRAFAALDATPASFLGFAGKYGALTYQPREEMPVETLRFWLGAHAWMSHCVRLWDLVQAKDAAALAAFVVTDGPAVRVRWEGAQLWREAGIGRWPEVDVVAKSKDGRPLSVPPERAVRRYLGNAISGEMGGAVHLVVDPVAESPAGRGHMAYLSPPHLWGGLVAQLALSVALGRRHRACAVCGRWFEIGGDAREDRTTCSGACRSRLSRKRRAKPKGQEGPSDAAAA